MKTRPVLGFHHHNASTIFQHISSCLSIGGKWIGNKFNFAGLVVIQDSVAFPYFLARMISEWRQRAPCTRASENLAHVQAAVDVQNLPGDVAGFVAGEENDGGGDVAVGAKAAERDHRFHFVF
jgi:hypothetical protein